MTYATILFVDNAPELLKARIELLEAQGYRMILAKTPSETYWWLDQGGIDLMILDVRLHDDSDEKDFSGLELAKEVGGTIPKIILTDHPTTEAALAAFRPQIQKDGLPIAVEFVSKKVGISELIQSIERALGPDLVWLYKVKQAIDGTEDEIKTDHEYVRLQSRVFFRLTLIAIIVGTSCLFTGIFFALWGKLDVVPASTIASVLTNVIGYLFFKRVDLANSRLDLYHHERVEGQRFQTLLQACNGLTTKQERENCRKQIILTAAGEWLNESKNNQKISEKIRK